MLVLNDADESQLLDEATLPLVQAPISDLTEYYNRLIKMFPDACPTYVMDLCQKQMKSGSINFDFIVVTMNTCKLQSIKKSSRKNFKQVICKSM